MEDNPGTLQREIANRRRVPYAKRSRGWTLMVLGDNGEVRTFPRFKGWVIGYFLLLAAAVAVAGGSWMVSRRPLDENRRLKKELAAVREQLSGVTTEKDLLMMRLVVSASRNAPADPAPPAPPSAAGEPETVAAGGDAASAKHPPAPAPSAKPVAAAALVDIDDLRVTQDTDKKLLHAQFMLKKVDSDPGSVTGRTFVILKDSTAGASRWLTMPDVPMTNGRPERLRNGRLFSISRFNIVKCSTPYNAPIGAYDKAAVLVYSLEGELLLEKSFDIRVATGPPPDQDIGE